MPTISEKYQLIDDESIFQYKVFISRLEELEGLTKKDVIALQKGYHTISVIGSQSSGKSTLLNALFGTTFDQLNRKKRIGQTTKGIWYSIDSPDSLMVIDVQGSDSNEREERTKIQRRNSLFALSVSHTLLINLWIQQIGLYKGSQLAILQIILELNLRLFGSQQPKNIIFVVRDYDKRRENKQALRQKLIDKVKEAWEKIKKPPSKEHVKLQDLFELNAFFLASKLDEPEEFYQGCSELKKHLIFLSNNETIIKSNVSMQDLPQYMKNIWETIESDKDINLPEQKILLSNMKCHEVKGSVYQLYEEQFRDELERSERKMNIEFADNIRKIVNKMMKKYNEETVQYIKEEVEKVREQFLGDLQRKIQLSYSYQVKHIIDECLRQFADEVNKLFIKDKNIENIKALKPQAIQKFVGLMKKVSYLEEWAAQQIKKYEETITITFKKQKQKIITESMKDFDRSIKKQIEAFVSNAFYNKTVFCDKFWEHINSSYKELQHKAKNSIVSLYNKLDYKSDKKQGQLGTKFISDQVEKVRNNAKQELKTIIEMKCNDLLYYIMRHFSVEFNLDEQQIPRQWPNYKIQEITQLYENTKEKYINILQNFSIFGLEDPNHMMESSATRLKRFSSINQNQGDQLLKSSEMASLRKKMEEQMKNQYQQSLKKNKQVYMGAIPKWAWIIFGIVAFDDVLLWIKSPMLALPITLVLIIIGLVFFIGGRGLASSLLNNARRAATNTVTNVATKAATGRLNN